MYIVYIKCVLAYVTCVHCNALQCVAVRCSALQCVAVCCSVLRNLRATYYDRSLISQSMSVCTYVYIYI